MIKELIQSIRSLGCLREFKLWLAIGFSILSSAMVLPVGLLIQLIFDRALPASDFRLLLILITVAIVLIVVNGFLSVSTRNSILQITKKEIFKIRTTLTSRILHSSHDYYLQADLSKVHKIAVYDTEKIDALLNSFFSILIPSVLVSSLLFVVLFFIDWPMSCILLLLSVISIGVIRYVRKTGKQSLTQFQRMFEVFHRHTFFVLEFHKLIKASSSQSTELSHHTKVAEQLNTSNQKMVDGFTKSASYQEMIFSVSSMILLLIGGHRVIQGAMTIGTLISFYFCLYLLKRYFNNISSVVPVIIEGNYSFHQYRHLLSGVQYEPYTGNKPLNFTGDIFINNISFSFASRKLFENFSMHFLPGTVTLLKGPNGSGKSTLIHLLLGFYKPDKGDLQADHIPYQDLDIHSLRKQISVLFQENLIFNGTVAENIRYARPGASDHEIDEAIRSASLEEFISSLPQGKESEVGEKGMKLSGGQRQKLGLARCFLSKAPLIIMDEPTNHLDQETINNFVNCLKNINHRPALLIVSHNEELSSIADQTYQLEL